MLFKETLVSSATPQVGLDREVFLATQKQIYNLMKFDSYGRFLKSELYQVSGRGTQLGNIQDRSTISENSLKMFLKVQPEPNLEDEEKTDPDRYRVNLKDELLQNVPKITELRLLCSFWWDLVFSPGSGQPERE